MVISLKGPSEEILEPGELRETTDQKQKEVKTISQNKEEEKSEKEKSIESRSDSQHQTSRSRSPSSEHLNNGLFSVMCNVLIFSIVWSLKFILRM